MIESAVLRIVVHSDLACPFCYLADATVARLSERWCFEVDWQAFELHPEIPSDGFLIEGAAATHFQKLETAVLWTAAMLKLPFNPPRVIPNSRRAMAAILALEDQDRVLAAILRRRLFEACYVEGLPISTSEAILEVARDNLEDPELTLLEDAMAGDEPARRVGEVKELGLDALVTVVPVFRFFPGSEERIDLRVVGAQAPEIFERVFETLGVERR